MKSVVQIALGCFVEETESDIHTYIYLSTDLDGLRLSQMLVYTMSVFEVILDLK